MIKTSLVFLSPTHVMRLVCSFAVLDAHVKALKDEEAARALAAAPAVKSRAANEAEDNGKKRKAKSKASQGVEKLKKVDVSGMAKISTFFQKK